MFIFHVHRSRIYPGIYTHIFAIDSNQVEAYVRTLSTICQPTKQKQQQRQKKYKYSKMKRMIRRKYTHTRAHQKLKILEPISNHMTDSTFSIEHQSQSDTWNAHKIFSADK